MSTSYRDVLARNVRGYRNRKGLRQARLAARMQALGFTAWRPQIVSKVEQGERRLLLEELFGLAAALEMSIARLMAPEDADEAVEFPSGESISIESMAKWIQGGHDDAVTWDGDTPVFKSGRAQTGVWLDSAAAPGGRTVDEVLHSAEEEG
jgi:transcriptional regulator with XRE-family HTH domain